MPFARIKQLKLTISSRIAILFCFTFSVGLFFAFLFTYFQISYSLAKSSKEIISAKLQEQSTILQNDGLEKFKENINDEKNRILNASFLFRVTDRAGAPIFFKPSTQEKKFDFNSILNDHQGLSGHLGWSTFGAIDDEDQFDMLSARAGENYILQVGKSSEDREDVLERLLFGFCLVGAFLILLSGATGIWYARNALAPLRNLSATFKKIEEGDLTKRVQAGGVQDELTELGETFNRMMSRTENLVLVMKESLDNVAHDVRTPLTRIKAAAEVALLSEKPLVIREALESAAEDASEISELVDQLMSISEAEAGTMQLQFGIFKIRQILFEVADIYEFVAQDKGITIEMGIIDENLVWRLDRKRIKQAVANLIDNAIKFSPANSKVTLSVTEENNQLKILVGDSGFGIAEHELERIWDRLFRGDKTRTTKGLGLGLSIVRAVVLAHRGTVSAKPGLKGMVFMIGLPKTT